MMTMTSNPVTINGVTLTGHHVPRQNSVLSPDALGFLAALHREFEPRRRELLQAREERRRAIARGTDPTFLPETRQIREDDSWRVPPPPPGLEDRRVEITGPTERKMTINALNSGAEVWLADMEDANTPHWTNVVTNQLNLIDALEGTIELTTPEGKKYALHNKDPRQNPTVVVRPRGWHLDERHLSVRDEPIAGAIVDFGLYFFHNARRLKKLGLGPYFYLPKTESHREARLWHDIFTRAESLLGVDRGTIRATVLIETITAAFEMEEILWELGEHAAGLNAGRWDYIFSIIKNFRTRGPRFILPDRNAVTMTQPFMRSYTEQLVRACHRRQAMAIGGMAAFIPSRRDEDVNRTAMEKVRADKLREANDGFDGSWVAHPDLVPVCREVFDEVLGDRPNQLDRRREDVVPDDKALIDIASAEGRITEEGIRNNVEVGIRYIEAWLRGNGAVAIHHLMEDAATAEISRSQIWQWVNTRAITDQGEEITREWVRELVDEEFSRIERAEGDRFDDARSVFEEVALGHDYPAFLTTAAYERFLAEPEDPHATEDDQPGAAQQVRRAG